MLLEIMLLHMILWISTNVHYQLITVLKLLNVSTIQDPSAVRAKKTTLVMAYHVNPLVRIMSNFSKRVFG